jgi:type II secretory pathway component GspD/PulD (secretin)
VEAKIHVGEMTWQITLKKDVVQTGAAPQTDYSEEATEVQLGLKLWVIPEIDLEADVVRMTVNPEMTVFVENITTPQGSIYPVTSTRTLTTRVNVPSGETLMIGGLIEYATSKKEKRVPFLGDIPIIGLLFRHVEEVTEKHNLVVMLTPTILEDAAPSTGYEAMGWQAIEEFEMTPLAPSKAPPKPSEPPVIEEEEKAASEKEGEQTEQMPESPSEEEDQAEEAPEDDVE